MPGSNGRWKLNPPPKGATPLEHLRHRRELREEAKAKQLLGGESGSGDGAAGRQLSLVTTAPGASSGAAARVADAPVLDSPLSPAGPPAEPVRSPSASSPALSP
jgi:hypothetical protein